MGSASATLGIIPRSQILAHWHLAPVGYLFPGRVARLVDTAHVAQSGRARATESRNLETSNDSATNSNAPTTMGSGALAVDNYILCGGDVVT